MKTDVLRDAYGRTPAEMLAAIRNAGWEPEEADISDYGHEEPIGKVVECSDGDCPDWQLSSGDQPLFWHHSHVIKTES